METKQRKIKLKSIIILLTILLIIGVVLVFTIKKNNKIDDGIKHNNNKSFVQNQKVKGIIFKNIKCIYDGKNSLISYTMVNKTGKKIYLNNYDVIVKDKNKVKLVRIAAHVTQTLSPNEPVDMANQVVGVDLTNAHYMELKLNTKKKDK